MTPTQKQNDELTERIEDRIASVSSGIDIQRQRIAQLEHALLAVTKVAELRVDPLSDADADAERVIRNARHVLGYN